MSRVELGRDRLVRRPDMQSPGSAGATGTFREAIGMNENGPVIPRPGGRPLELFASRRSSNICVYAPRRAVWHLVLKEYHDFLRPKWVSL